MSGAEHVLLSERGARPAGLSVSEGAGGASAVGRLTAVWALAEVGLGGALHALRLPLTGLLVGSSAVVLLALIAHAARRAGKPVARTLLGATAVVLGVKAAASPHAPLGAYLAVAFQGGLSALVLPLLGRRIGALVLGVVALVESGAQRVLMLTLLFGAAFWDAVDALGGQAARQLGELSGWLGGGDPLAWNWPGGLSPSAWLIGLYLGAHVLAGGIAGVLAMRWPTRIFAAAAQPEARRLAEAARSPVDQPPPTAAERAPRAWWRRRGVRRVGGAFALLVGYAALGWLGGERGPAVAALVAVARAVVLVALWGGVIAPLGLRLIGRIGRRGDRAEAITRTAAMLPEFATLARLAWAQTRGARIRRPLRFAVLFTAAALADPTDSILHSA